MLAVIPLLLFAFQYDLGPGFAPRRSEKGVPYTGHPSRLDPRVRRAEREKCVARVGEACRPLVETHSSAIAALNACSPEMGKKLSEFHNEGHLAKMPSPVDLLKIISIRGHGDEVADWAMKHAAELADPDAFSAFLAEPLEYVLDLKKLAAGATEARARRLAGPPTNAPALASQRAFTDDWRNLALVGGGIGLVILFFWRNKQRQANHIVLR